MRMTTRGRYAIRAALAMARLGRTTKPVSIRRMAEEEGISSIFLEQIFFKLRQSGLVKSVRGPGGGFIFSKDLSELNVKDILDAAGEGLQFAPCDHEDSGCARKDYCIAQEIWDEASQTMNDYFTSLTLADLDKRFGDQPERPQA